MQDAINNKYYVLKTRTCQGILLIDYSNPKWFVEGHPDGVSFHKLKKSTNDIGLLYLYNIKLSLAPHSSLSKYASLELAQQADRIVL
jgi:hypothetical protein